jgi:hypothetical protein
MSPVLSEAVIDKSVNNWRRQKHGESHLNNLGENRRRPSPVSDRAVLDRYGAELTEISEPAGPSQACEEGQEKTRPKSKAVKFAIFVGRNEADTNDLKPAHTPPGICKPEICLILTSTG